MSQLIEQPPISLIPESAPFTPEQRAWLNGFFAGWLGLSGGAAGDAPAAPVQEEEESFPWHDPALPIDDRLKLAESKPLPRKLMAAMAQLDCGACGYVCQTYAEKIASGEEGSLTLCAPGGKETSKTLKRLLKESAAAPPTASPVAAAPADAGEKWSRRNPYPAKLLRAYNLNAPASRKRTTHVELDLGDGGLEYAAGDSLGVVPTNCEELVGELLRRLGATGDEPVPFADGPVPLRTALAERLCLSDVTESLLTCLADAATGDEARALRALVDDDGPIQGCDVFDLLRRFPSARPEPSAFASALSSLRPRLYSISSSPKATPRQVHLTVGRVAWEHDGRARKGVCSTFFADRLREGAAVPVFVQKSHGFTVPADPAVPMIMVGPGTGIAPFRAFLQERAATGATGRNWLFFGDQREADDFLYREELAGHVASGLLTKLSTAFSRDGVEKVYVQHRMTEHGPELWRWLQDGGHFYVCGDAKRMAADVDRALKDIVAANGGMSPEAAAEFVARLAAEGRYRRDVY